MPGKATTPRTCKQCGTPFDARLDAIKAGGGVFCSHRCAQRGRVRKRGAETHTWRGGGEPRTCPVCSAGFVARRDLVARGLGQYCSRACGSAAQRGRAGKAGADHPQWRGGIRRHADGYIYEYCPDHPNNRQGYVFQHRLVVERALGRYLTPDEEVHHHNDVKDDNKVENLRLMTKAEHARLHLARRQGATSGR